MGVFLNIGSPWPAGPRTRTPPRDRERRGAARDVPVGRFFPTDTLPQVLEKMVLFLPLTPLIEALRMVSIEGQSILDTGPHVLLLGGWVVVSFFLAGGCSGSPGHRLAP